MSENTVQQLTIVDLDYNDLLSGKDLTEQIHTAFGPNGYGILTVSNVPNVKQYRKELLPLSYKFANLPEDVKEKYVDADSDYSFGWSHGKETLNGKRDFAKGSYYANPLYDSPTSDEELKKKAPFFCRDNIWPADDVPQMEKAFKNMSRLLVDVGKLVSKQCDLLAQKTYKNYKPGTLHKTIEEGKCHKARLLYYFPMDKPKQDDDASNADSWCGWHNDTDTLTGLLKAMYFDKDGNSLDGHFSDSKAGLYIRDRKGELRRGSWRTDQIAFQIGECSQIVTGGELRATPHCVRGSKQAGVGRAQMACFMQPTWDDMLSPPEGVDMKECNLPRIEKPMTFMEYGKVRFSEYYGQEDKKQ